MNRQWHQLGQNDCLISLFDLLNQHFHHIGKLRAYISIHFFFASTTQKLRLLSANCSDPIKLMQKSDKHDTCNAGWYHYPFVMLILCTCINTLHPNWTGTTSSFHTGTFFYNCYSTAVKSKIVFFSIFNNLYVWKILAHTDRARCSQRVACLYFSLMAT